jgi:hypothetical protein
VEYDASGMGPTVVTMLADDANPHLQILTDIDTYLEQAGWDQDPAYWQILDEGDGLVVKPMRWMPPPLYQNPGANLGPFIRWLGSEEKTAAAMRQLMQTGNIFPENFYGVVMFCEAWSVAYDKEKVAREDVGVTVPTPMNHPDRVEIRTGTIVTTDGEVGMLVHQRDGETTTWLLSAEADIEGGEHSGRLLDGLRNACTLFERMAKDRG